MNDRAAMTAATMTRDEREGLQRLARQRERVRARPSTAAPSSSPTSRTRWDNAIRLTRTRPGTKPKSSPRALLTRRKERFARRCRELGIPDRFAPSLSLHRHDSGYDNTLKEDMTRLRRMAVTRVEAIEQKAVVEIEVSCLKAQEAVALAGLGSDAAKLFVGQALMPKLCFAEVAGESDPPVAEQLVKQRATPATLPRAAA
jgi:hypothetical protein